MAVFSDREIDSTDKDLSHILSDESCNGTFNITWNAYKTYLCRINCTYVESILHVCKIDSTHVESILHRYVLYLSHVISNVELVLDM